MKRSRDSMGGPVLGHGQAGMRCFGYPSWAVDQCQRPLYPGSEDPVPHHNPIKRHCMSRLLGLTLLVVAQLLCFDQSVASEPCHPHQGLDPAKPDPPEIERLIEQLGSSRFSQRRAAGRAILQIGQGTMQALRRAASNNKDAEIRSQATALIHELENRLDNL